MYPEISIREDFDHYYLYEDNAFLMDNDFGEKIHELTGRLYDEIYFSIRLPKPGDAAKEGIEAMLRIPFHYKHARMFYDVQFEQGIHLSMLDYNISDKSGLWQIYVSEQLEFALLGCKAEINERFKSLFKPYSITTLAETYASVNVCRIDHEKFTEHLEKRFRITENSL